MPPLKHIHQYVRFSKTRPDHLKCIHPKCTSWVPKEYMMGKESICNYCGQVFIFDSYSIELKRPKCHTCKVNKVKRYQIFLEPTVPVEEKTTGDKFSELVNEILSEE